MDDEIMRGTKIVNRQKEKITLRAKKVIQVEERKTNKETD